MKARIATVLSLTGVLVAGSAAALVNNQVLHNTAPVENTTFALGTALPSSSDAPESSVTVTADSDPINTIRVYEIPKIGRVSVDTANGQLRLVSGKPASGWTVSMLDQTSATKVTVRFTSVLGTVVFTGELVNGEVTTDVSLEANPGDSSTSSSAPQTTSGGSNGGKVTTTTNRPRSTTTSVDDHHDDHGPSTTDDHKGGGGGGGGDD